MESCERRLHYAIAALLEPRPQRLAAARQQDGAAEADDIRGKVRGIVCSYRDALFWPDVRMDQCQSLWREGGRMIHNGAARQRVKACVEVVEGWIGQLQCNTRHAEFRGDHLGCLHSRAETAAHPEESAVRVPEAIAGTFERDARRQRDDLTD